jgi:hypothetical protein
MNGKIKIILKKILYGIYILYLAALTLATITCFCMWPWILFGAALSCATPGSCKGLGGLIYIFMSITPLVLLGDIIIAFRYFYKKEYLKSVGLSLGILIGICAALYIINTLNTAYYRGTL